MARTPTRNISCGWTTTTLVPEVVIALPRRAGQARKQVVIDRRA
jgi:hypothetical protein